MSDLHRANDVPPQSSGPDVRRSTAHGDGLLTLPTKQGLYDPRFEHDACGVAFVATLTGTPSSDYSGQAGHGFRNWGNAN